MSKNLSIRISHPTASVLSIRYARVDNTNNPIWNTIPNKNISSEIRTIRVAENVPEGVYRIEAKPVYPDGRSCEFSFRQQEDCPVVDAVNAFIDGDEIVVRWSSVTSSTRVNISYPNGGRYSMVHSNTSPNMEIRVPVGSDVGSFNVTAQNVCNLESGFYSTISSTVIISNDEENSQPVNPNSTVEVNTQVASFQISGVSGLYGFELGSPAIVGLPRYGNFLPMENQTIGVFLSGVGISESALYLRRDGLTIATLSVPSGGTGLFTFPGLHSFSEGQQIVIQLIGVG